MTRRSKALDCENREAAHDKTDRHDQRREEHILDEVVKTGGGRGAMGLAVLFGLNIPACTAPLLFAILGSAAVGGASGLGQAAVMGFVSLAMFGLALSLPLALAILWPPVRRALDRATAIAERAPTLIGLLLVALGIWSIYFGLFVTPRP